MGSYSIYGTYYLVLCALCLPVVFNCNDEVVTPSQPPPDSSDVEPSILETSPPPDPSDAEPSTSEAFSQPPPVFVAKTPTSDYRFIVDGEDAETTFHSLTKLDADPQAGDIASVYGRMVILGEPGVVRLKTTSHSDGRTLRIGANGDETLYSFVYRWNIVDDNPELTKTNFDSIKLSQLRHARSVSLRSSGAEAAKILRHIDPTRACVTFAPDFNAPDSSLPPLPRKLRCLVLARAGDLDLSRLRALRELRFLEIHGQHSSSLDGRWLTKATKLRHLIIQAPIELVNTEALETLEKLLSLDMANSGRIDSIGFVEKLRSLRRLDISFTEVTDLSPIAKAASLQEVRADLTPVDTLPQTKVPNLRKLSVVSTKLGDGSIARFRTLNPSCEIQHRPDDALEIAAKGVTRLRVRWGGVCHRRPENEKTIAIVDDPEAVRDFLSHIAFEKDGGGACACCGRLTFELYRQQELAVALSLHHGKRLRWMEGWPNDETLTKSSRAFLIAWLGEKGIKFEEEPSE